MGKATFMAVYPEHSIDSVHVWSVRLKQGNKTSARGCACPLLSPFKEVSEKNPLFSGMADVAEGLDVAHSSLE